MRTDHIGRPVFATDGTGAVVWEASYGPFGGVTSTVGPNSDLRFPGQWFQSETALHQNWMRDYDPTLGRYLQADPLGLVDGASVYGYALQNPGRYTDPRGEAVYLMCRPLANNPGLWWWYHGAQHCAVFVTAEDCNCENDDPDEIIAQFSLPGQQQVFDLEQRYNVHGVDRSAFLNPNWQTHIKKIPVPSGMNRCEFNDRVIREGENYKQPSYDPINGPNSNTAANNLLRRAEANVKWWNKPHGRNAGDAGMQR